MTPVPRGSVSIALCTFNGARYLQAQLDSILAQTTAPYELIACDDGSSDATLDILHEFQRGASFPVHILRNEKNLGSTSNFDQAMQLASGEYIALADQDDVWMPHKLATLVSALQGDPSAGGAFSDARLLDTRNDSKDEVLQQTLWSLHDFGARKQQAFRNPGGATRLLLQAPVVTGATLMVRSSLRSFWHPIPRSWVHDGWMVWVLAAHSRLLPVSTPLILYRLHGGQQLGVGSGEALGQRIRTMQQSERARYERIALQFEELRDRLSEGDFNRPLDEQLQQKIHFMHRRAHLPRSPLTRLLTVIGSSGKYRKYARGWRSMRKDALLGGHQEAMPS